MLVDLTIANFAIISHLEIHFKTGLTILSGETGAGKSIIINAVNLILGGRASTDLIRSGANEARVEALFSLPENTVLREFMDDRGLPFDGELLIKRTVSREGRNRITINGSMATAQMLSQVGLMIISISGQHEHQMLLKSENHLHLLDDFGGLVEERCQLNESFGRFESVKEGFRQLEKEIKEGKERQELAEFQIKEIEGAAIKEKEDTLLEEERKRLRHAEQLKEIISESYQTLYEKGDSILSNLSSCIKLMTKGAEMDGRLDPIIKALTSARVELEEAGLELRDLRSNIVIDPFRLGEVEERLQVINRLKRKYGPALEDVFDFKDRLSGIIDNLDRKEEALKRIKDELHEIQSHIITRAEALSGKRKDAALRLESSVESELAVLDMEGTRFEVRFHREAVTTGDGPDKANMPLRADGYDRVEFLISPNVGEELRPLVRIASGGELSRIMLAMKTILARTTSVESIIFDEVDAGIGGATAEVVGEKLLSLSQFHQILCITHLPQIAAKGETHFLVKKHIKDKRSQTIISELDRQERVKEIARLLAGKVISKQALAHAREMLANPSI